MLQTLSDTVRSTIRAARRPAAEALIRNYAFPSGLRRKIGVQLDIADPEAIERVIFGLKAYFLLCLDGRDMVLGMPSKAVDVAWHQFILHTRDYTTFCQRVYGGYLHHRPNDEPSTDDDFLSGAGRAWMDIGRTWIVSCMRSGQNPRKPTEVPLLFSIDAELGIAGGEAFTLEDLADLPIPPGFIETEPGRYRYIAPKLPLNPIERERKRRAAGGSQGAGGCGGIGSDAGGGCGGGGCGGGS